MTFPELILKILSWQNDRTKQAFMVEGRDGKKYSVTLYPEDCQCRATGTCYHVIAAKLSAGIPLARKHKPINMTAFT